MANNNVVEFNSVKEEIEGLRQSFPKVKIQSATNDFITASYQRTPSTCVKITTTFPKGYPKDHAIVVTVNASEVVPPGLKKKLEKELGKAATDSNVAGTHRQVHAVFSHLVTFLDTNKFVPCWKELRQVVDKISKDDSSGSTIKIDDSKGLIKLRLKHGKYYYACSIFINDGYPSTTRHEDYGTACKLRMDSTNFPPKIELMLRTQAHELVRRMQDGMNAEQALQMSNPVRLPKHFNDNGKEETKVRLTKDAVKGLKKDTETLKYVRDLRQVNSETKHGDSRVKTHTAKERKEARRTVAKITKAEIEQDTSAEEQNRQWQLEEQKRLEGYDFTEFDGSHPERSLLSLVIFLIHKIQRLPEEICPVCKELTLPSDPTKLAALYTSPSEAKTDKEKRLRREARKRRPMRTYCGCWYHYSCLNTFMTEPPFGAACLTKTCGRRVYHPEWPGEIQELERTWANKQARLREIADASLFL